MDIEELPPHAATLLQYEVTHECVQARNHVDLMEALDLIDFDTAGDVSGSKFYYLRNAAALLEMALVNMALQVCTPAR